MAKRQHKVFFSSEYSVRLFADKEDGTHIVICDGEELFFKLRFDKMKLSNPEEFFRRYPDGWVKGRVTFLPPTARKIEIALCDLPARYLNLNRGDIYDVAYEKPNNQN